jgi:hypothetical protein
MADNKGGIKRFKLANREEAEMSNLTDEDIRQMACSEWARWMESYGSGRPRSLNNQRQTQIKHKGCNLVSRHQQPPQLTHNRRLKSAKAA